MALMRPTDAVWVTLPLLALVLVRRHWPLLLVLAGGLAAGGVEWVIEAHAWYGGLGERLARASEIQGGLGWNIAVDDQMRSLGGRGLCRPCTGAMPHPVVTAWWLLLPVVAVLGVAVAVRARRATATLVPFACAVTAAVPYLFLIGYAAPRFLQPAYALLAVPVADALWHLAGAGRDRWRPVAATLVALAVAGHLAVQFSVLVGTVDRNVESREDWARVAGELHRLGVRPPCLLTGHESIPVGYYTGCSSGSVSGNNENTTAAEIVDTARRIPVAAITGPGGTPPGYARDWTPHRITDLEIRVAPRVRDRVSGNANRTVRARADASARGRQRWARTPWPTTPTSPPVATRSRRTPRPSTSRTPSTSGPTTTRSTRATPRRRSPLA